MEWENVDIQELIKKPKKVVDDRITEIKNFRIKQGWTQKNMAEYLEIPTITYIQWENGTRTPPSYVLNLIKYKLNNNTEQIKISDLENYVIEIIHESSKTRIYSRIATYKEYLEFETNYWYVEYIKNKKGYKVNYYLLKKI